MVVQLLHFFYLWNYNLRKTSFQIILAIEKGYATHWYGSALKGTQVKMLPRALLITKHWRLLYSNAITKTHFLYLVQTKAERKVTHKTYIIIFSISWNGSPCFHLWQNYYIWISSILYCSTHKFCWKNATRIKLICYYWSTSCCILGQTMPLVLEQCGQFQFHPYT